MVEHGLALALSRASEFTLCRIRQSRPVRLFRCSLRVGVKKNLAHLARRTPPNPTLAPPRQRLVHISGFQDPKTAYVLLGLQVRAVGDEHLAVGMGPQRLGLAQAAGEFPDASSDHLAV